ncbi:MAG: hypothetical protein ACM3X6_11840 [Patescibacteria group bacterium]
MPGTGGSTKKGKARKRKPALPKPKTAKDRLKLAIIRQLGLVEKIRREGWGSLSAQECGQVGGLLSRTLKEAGAAAPGEKPLGNISRA